MIDIIGYTQRTLDKVFCLEPNSEGSAYNVMPYNLPSGQKPADTPLQSCWLLRQDLTRDDNPDEYIVYTVNEHEPVSGADGADLIFRSYVTVRYFCRDSWIGDAEKYTRIRQRLDQIRKALKAADFEISSGWQDVGDVDGISFETFVLQAEYTEVDNGD